MSSIIFTIAIAGILFATSQIEKNSPFSIEEAEAFHNGGLVQISVHQFTWTDPVSGGTVEIVEEVFEGCVDFDGTFIPHDMTFQYVVANQSYDPVPGVTNGFSGFQIIFPQQVPELYNQMSPAVGGPWIQNSFSGQFPPFGVEWDVPQAIGNGILPGQIGTFSFCTFEREDLVVNSPPDDPLGMGPNGWAHSWIGFGQVNLFNAPISVPGELFSEPEIACEEDTGNHVICKKVKYVDEDGDGIIEVGEKVDFLVVFQVLNPSGGDWTETTVKDNFGAELGLVTQCIASTAAGADVTLKGKTDKVQLKWNIGTLGPGESASLACKIQTDINPGGQQEYSSPGEYEFNSGAVLKFLNPDDKQRSFETGGISVVVECNENEEVDSPTGDCVCIPGFEENPNGICVSATV